MNRQEIYDSWKNQRSQMDIRNDFSENLMDQVYKYEQKRNKPVFDYQRFIKIVSYQLSVRTAILVVGAAMGLVRFLFLCAAVLGYQV